VIYNRQIKSIYYKQFLPNYSVFDEERYFKKGIVNHIFKIAENLIGINICEDIFHPAGPAKIQSTLGGAELLINISASPYHTEKIKEREKILINTAKDNCVNIVYANLIGGQDELVFDGNSIIVKHTGEILKRAASFEEDTLIYDLDTVGTVATKLKNPAFKSQKTKMSKYHKAPVVVDLKYRQKKRLSASKERAVIKYKKQILCQEHEILKALTLGTRDYVRKNRFDKVVIALSGGIDSALTAVIAFLSLGKENVNCILMPSIYSSVGSVEDAGAY